MMAHKVTTNKRQFLILIGARSQFNKAIKRAAIRAIIVAYVRHTVLEHLKCNSTRLCIIVPGSLARMSIEVLRASSFGRATRTKSQAERTYTS